jgi:ankyrin repeat protein
VNKRDEKGQAALLRAAQWGAAESVTALIDAGAGLTGKNNDRATALTLARNQQRDDVVQILVAKGAPE